MEKKEELYEGKAKVIFSTDNPNRSIMYFKDDATAFDGKKKGTINDKGVINNKISSEIFRFLEKNGVKSHFVEELSEREMLVKKVEIIPVEVIIRNIIAGSLAKRLGIEEGTKPGEVIIEFCYKSDELGDPFINEYVARAMGYATKEEMDEMTRVAFKVNELLSKFFDERGILLVDYKLEFGRSAEDNGAVLLADEITPDGCRLWDKVTKEKLDKDRFRRDLGGVEEAYGEVLKKVTE
ncbi:MAG: phosphoribosylaminoimidazolesuccinocarboxamide synthase [Deltaproteobacteria bacterium]|nr:phosphoribosylaminoimidazolesuccinocarboxamide synthase [Deltaproteobacteria bacterium]